MRPTGRAGRRAILAGLAMLAAGCSGASSPPSDPPLADAAAPTPETAAPAPDRSTSTTSTSSTTSTTTSTAPEEPPTTTAAPSESPPDEAPEPVEPEPIEIDVSDGTPVVAVAGTKPIEDMPLPGPERPAIDVSFGPGEVSSTENGSIDFRERQTYTVQASEGQPFTATLDAPVGVWLDVRLDDLVVTSASQRSQLVTAELPASGPWQLTVVSSHAGPVDFELSIEVLPVVEVSPAPTTTVVRVAPPRPATPDDEGAVVYLTFDDGPHPEYTPQVLDILARYDARATFFVVGSLAATYPAIIERIAAEGHTIANHTWRHEDLAKLSRPMFDETVGRTQAILGDLATPCLRPPYGSVGANTREWAASHGLSILTWDGSPMDWLRPPATEIADYLVRWAPSGAVILLHDGGGNRANTVQGLEMAMERLVDQDLRFEPVCRRPPADNPA